MQKKLMALAVAGALGAPLLANAQTVQIYGRANLGLDNYSATGAANSAGNYASRMRVFDSASRLGFRGSENLGGGMEAYFVMETGVNWDAGGQTGQGGQVNASSGFPASRDSFLGLRGGFGEVSWGRQSVFWVNGLNAQSGPNYINASADNILTGVQLVAPPSTRQSNTMYYTSPRMAGIDVAIAYSPNTQEPAAYTGTNQSKGDLWGVNLKYRLGGLYVQGDWAKNRNKGNVSGVNDTGIKLGVSYGYAPGARIAFIGEQLKNDNISAATATADGTFAAAGDSPKVKVFMINWEQIFGMEQVMVGYAWTSKIKGFTGGEDNTACKSWHIGVKHLMSKRTGIYASYNAIKNQDRAICDYTGGAYTSGATTAAGLGSVNAGADPRIIGVGMMHNF
jgi:predicted porin